MKRVFAGAAAAALVPGLAGAVGLDRSGQDIGLLFEDGNYAQLSFGSVMPDVDGQDVAAFGGMGSGNVAEDFTTLSLGVKYQYTDSFSAALILDEPYGSDISYPEDGSVALGGTEAIVDSQAVTLLGRYEFDNNFSVHGGLSYREIEAQVTLQGAAYGALSGYRAKFDRDGDLGFVIGGAYERPDIALRLAVTYFSGTEHDLDTTETVNGVGVGNLPPAALGLPVNPFSTNTTTTVDTPEAINIAFQTGIAPKTLLLGSFRYAWYEDTRVSPAFFDAGFEPGTEGSSLAEIEDNYALTLGLGRQLTDDLSGSVTVGYERARDDLVSPLAPTNGNYSLALGLSYDVTESFNISGGARYTWVGDSKPETGTPDTARADFEDNDTLAIGLSVGYRF